MVGMTMGNDGPWSGHIGIDPGVDRGDIEIAIENSHNHLALTPSNGLAGSRVAQTA
jgi:hypothetical protein